MSWVLFLMGLVLSGCSSSSTGTIGSTLLQPPLTTLVNVSVTSLSFAEGESKTFEVALNTPALQPLTVDWAVQNSNASQTIWQKIKSLALSEDDFTSLTSSVTLPAGVTSASITIGTLADGKFEGTESFALALTSAAFSGSIEIPLTITDSDQPPSISLTNVYTQEGQTASLLVRLSRRSELPVHVTLGFEDDTAIAGTDYVPPSSSVVTIPANQLLYNVDIEIPDNNTSTGDKRFKVNVSSPVNATVDTPQASFFIMDNESAAKLSIADLTVDEGAGHAELTVTLSSPASGPVVFDWVTDDGTALTGPDYAGASGAGAVILSGATSTVLRVPLVNDDADEDNETFKILLGNARGASLDRYAGTVTINDNDDPPTIQWSVVSQSVLENAGAVQLRAELSAASGKIVSVVLNTSGTATPNDHSLSATSISVPPGSIHRDLEFRITNDSLTASLKTLTVTMADPSHATLGATSAHSVNIIDDDGDPILFVGNATVQENGGTVSIPVSLGKGIEAGEQISFDWSVSSGSASTPADFTATPARVTVSGPATVAQVSVTVTDDDLYEGAETFSITLNNPSVGASLQSGAEIGYITINDNDAEPDVSFQLAAQSVNESAGSATIVVQLSQPAGHTVIVPYTVGGTATYGASGTADHGLLGGKLMLPAGSTSTSIIVPINNDSLSETDETIMVSLAAPTGGRLGATIIHTFTIIDNDTAPVLSIGNASSAEGAQVSFSVTLSQASGQTITVDYAIADGTATRPGDYTVSPTNATLTFYPGETAKSVPVETVDDALFEPSENFSVTLSNTSHASIGSATAAGTINDNEGPPSLSINDAVADEGQSIDFTVSLSGASSNPVTVQFDTADGNLATPALNALVSDSDYTARSAQTLTIPAGQMSGTITVNTTHDSRYEENEEFRILLTNAAGGATIGDGGGIGTIRNNDQAAVVQFTQSSSTASEDVGSHTVAVSLAQPMADAVTVNYAIHGSSTATGTGTDYTLSAGALSFSAGGTTKNISIIIQDDILVESTETIVLTLASPSSNAALGLRVQHAVNITDNDTAPTVIGFNPAQSNVGSIPASVQVSFSRLMDATSAQNTANWSVTCSAGGSASISGVSLASTVATVSLNVGTQPSAGGSCTLSASTSITDPSANALGGTLTERQVVYTKLTPASITSVTSIKANGAYRTGETIPIQVVFSEAVTVTGGTPSISLETGAADAVVSLTSGTGTTTLSGIYTVANGENSADLNYASTAALALNGATIKNTLNVDADLTLPALASASSLAGQKALVIDTTAPAAPTAIADGSWIGSTTTTPSISFTAGTDTGGSGIAYHEARVIRASDSAALSAFAAFTSGSQISGLILADGTQYKVEIRAIDNAGNASIAAVSDGWTVDTTAPTAPGAITLGGTPADPYREAPTMTFTASADTGGSGVIKYQIQIHDNTNAVAVAWADATTSGSSTITLNYSQATSFMISGGTYYARVRAVDLANNNSSATQTATWQVNPDPHINNVVLALHMDGIDGETLFVDEKQHAVHKIGTPQLSTAQSKFGGTSGYFNGSSGLNAVGSGSDFQLNGDFTIEGWYYLTSNSGSYFSLFSLVAGASSVEMRYGDSGFGHSLQYIVGGNPGNLTSSIGVTKSTYLNTWVHIALTRSGTTVRLFINGALNASSTSSASVSNTNFWIGHYNSSSYFPGYIDDFRVTNGVARYTANFTPPSQAFAPQAALRVIAPSAAVVDSIKTLTALSGTGPYTYSIASGGGSIHPTTGTFTAPSSAGTTVVRVTDATNTSIDVSIVITADIYRPNMVLGLHMDGASGSSTFTDVLGHPINNIGAPQLSTAQSKFGGTSGYFNNGSGLTAVGSGSDFQLNGDFTIEGWFYFNSTSYTTYVGLFGMTAGGSTVQLRYGDSGYGHRLQYIVGTDPGNLKDAVNVTKSTYLNTWVHIALSRSGSTVRLFIDGTLNATSTSSASISGTNFQVGHLNSAYFFQGYIDDFRITNGAARYTTDFTPPIQTFD